MTQEDYAAGMRMAQAQMQSLGAKSIHQDLSLNLLVYMTWQFVCDAEQYPSVCLAYLGSTFAFTANTQYM